MANVTFRSMALIKGSKAKVVLAMTEGQMDPEVATELGLMLYSPKDGDSVWYYDHPNNVMAIRTIKSVYAHYGFKVKMLLQNGQGQDISGMLHPREVKYHSRDYAKTFLTDTGVQAPVSMDKVAMGIIAKNHPRLASAAILYLIEDFDPEEMKEKLRKDPKRGEVWGFCQRMSKAEKLHTGYDFKITMCKAIWDRLDGPTKRYMIDHELMHCGRNERGGWETWDHDLQLFTEEVARYGGRIKEIDAVINGLISISGKAADRRNKQQIRKKRKKPKAE